MRTSTPITIEHIVIASHRSFEQVTKALEAHLGEEVDWSALGRQLLTTHASWEQVTQAAALFIGPSGFTIFDKIEEDVLFRLAGKPRQMCQYLIGNPLLALQLFESRAEAALYAPLRVVVYEDDEGKTFVAYDSFTSQLAQYQREEITQVARLVEHRLEALVAEVVVGGEAKQDARDKSRGEEEVPGAPLPTRGKRDHSKTHPQQCAANNMQQEGRY